MVRSRKNWTRVLALGATLAAGLGMAGCAGDPGEAAQPPCTQYKKQMADITTASERFSDVPDNQDLYVRAAHMQRLIQQRNVYQMTQKILARSGNMADGIAATSKKAAGLDAKIQVERGSAMSQGQMTLASDDGVGRTLDAALWRQVSARSAQLEMACASNPGGVARGDAVGLVNGATVIASDDHGVATDDLINSLLAQ